MAAVHGPLVSAHPSPFQNTQSIPHLRMGYHPAPSVSFFRAVHYPSFCFSRLTFSPATHLMSPIQLQIVSHLCAQFITHLFTCPEYCPSPSNSQVKLPHFTAYALHCTKLHTSVTFAALYSCQRSSVMILTPTNPGVL
ncbi:hypothetical protein BDR07DRAFT_1575269 [Suillus spraguei]|nr:hypothetical protein BDR07DRAFT_1575269 [Suillus spraguei]